MSDEKLSEMTKQELQKIAEGFTGILVPRIRKDMAKVYIEKLTPLLARLERERASLNATISGLISQRYALRTALTTARGYVNDIYPRDPSSSVRELEKCDRRRKLLDVVDAALNSEIAEQSLSPSVVSQPSREREAPNQPAERCLEWLGPFQCERNAGHSESCQFDSSRKRVYSQDELKAAVAAGKKIASVANEKLCARITDYLSKGGLFNPEAMNGDMVRDLIMDCYAALTATPASTSKEKP